MQMWIYSYRTYINFGKYEENALPLYQILKKDPGFIEDCIINLKWFVIKEKDILSQRVKKKLSFKAFEENMKKTQKIKEFNKKQEEEYQNYAASDADDDKRFRDENESGMKALGYD